MTSDRVVMNAMQKGMAFIKSAQAADGGFASFSSASQSPFRQELSYQTVFGPALILACLAKLDSANALAVRKKLADWLLVQRSPHWSFNYWAKSAPQRSSLPYPDDLDDTFCSLIALNRHDPATTDAECLGKVVRLLIAAEKQVGGPYRTWLAGQAAPEVWKDVDLAVNSNIACFLGAVAEPLPNLTAMIEAAIDKKSFGSPYYPSPYPIIYYLGRAYQGPRSQELAGYIKRLRRKGWWGSPLKTALALTALASLGQRAKQDDAITGLLKAQRADGSWDAEAFCLDPAIKGRTYYSGSPALTTAFVLEALAALRPPPEPQAGASKSADKRVQTIYQHAQDEISHNHSGAAPLLKQSLAALSRIKKIDSNGGIVLLPYAFNNSLIHPLAGNKDSLLLDLSLANLYGWTAYTIYDDFLDGEGDPKLLSVANSSLRYSLSHFASALPEDKKFQSLVAETFDTIDQANAWESACCRLLVTSRTITIGRLPAYPKTLSLADRSIGHTLTPLGVLAAGGVAPDDRRSILLQRAFQHYLVARQLNDDLHDWEEDLRSGLATYVVTAILKDLSLPAGNYSFARLIPKMQRQFWRHTLTGVCRIITGHTSQARRCAQSSGLLQQPNLINTITEKIDKTVEYTLSEQSKAEGFLAAYSNTNTTIKKPMAKRL